VRKRTVATYVIAALVAGVVLGSFGIASAATSTTQTATGARLRLGSAVQTAQATLADIVAKLTGKTVDEVRDDRAAGTSFADIASESGVSSSKIVSDALTARKAMLDDLVKQGKITQAQADAALARMTTRLNDRVSSTTGCTGAGPGAGTGAGGGYGRGSGGGNGRGSGGVCGGCIGTATTTSVQ
jgi:hypothetical protein